MTLLTTDRAALHNPFALFPSSRLHIREGVKTEPIITQGNQAIWHTDQWTLDWWVSYLDECPPRGTLALPYCCHRDRVGGKGGVETVDDCQGHLAATAVTQCIRPSRRGSYGRIWPQSKGFMQNRMQELFFHFTDFSCAYGMVQGGRVARNDRGSLKKIMGDRANAPVIFLKGYFEGFRKSQLTVIPSSCCSRLSLITVRIYVETMTLNTA